MTDHADIEMPCADVVRLLWDYMDDELNDALRVRVRHHLDVCEHCREHFTFEGAFLRAVALHLDGTPVAATLRARIVDALRAEGFLDRL